MKVKLKDSQSFGLGIVDDFVNEEFVIEVKDAYGQSLIDAELADEVTESGGTTASYKIYKVLLTQSGETAPVATVLENTLGWTPVWSRDGVGAYRVDDPLGEVGSRLPFGKTWGIAGGVSDDIVLGGWTKFIEAGSYYWQLFVYDHDGILSDEGLVNCSILLEVYP